MLFSAHEFIFALVTGLFVFGLAKKVLLVGGMAPRANLVFNGVANQFYTTRLPFRDDCLSHETYPGPVELPLGNGQTLAALFEAARATVGGPLGGGAAVWLAVSGGDVDGALGTIGEPPR